MLMLRAVCIKDKPLLKAYKDDVIIKIEIKIATAVSIKVKPDILLFFLKRI